MKCRIFDSVTIESSPTSTGRWHDIHDAIVCSCQHSHLRLRSRYETYIARYGERHERIGIATNFHEGWTGGPTKVTVWSIGEGISWMITSQSTFRLHLRCRPAHSVHWPLTSPVPFYPEQCRHGRASCGCWRFPPLWHWRLPSTALPPQDHLWVTPPAWC